MAGTFVPYCGVAPVPGAEAWNLDPALLAGLAIGLAGGVSIIVRSKGRSQDLLFFAAGWATLALAFVSPLCNVSVALFSARALQHMILTLVAAPLLVRGLIGSFQGRRPVGGVFAVSSAIAFTLCFWFWHSPFAYDATLENNAVYWAMHATMLGSALALWVAVFRSRGLIAFSIVSAISLQMSMLGALLTFASAPFYQVHALTTAAWELTWAQDQQLGGLLMWVPAGLLLVLYSATALAFSLRESEEPEEFAFPALATAAESRS